LKINKPQDPKKFGKYLNLPFQMLAIIGVGVWGGIKLDQLFNFKFPLLTLILTILAVILAIYYAIKDLIK